MGNYEGDGPDGGVDGLLDGGGPEGRVGLGILGSEETVCALVDYLLGEGQRVQLVDYLVEVGQRQHFHLLLSLGKQKGRELEEDVFFYFGDCYGRVDQWRLLNGVEVGMREGLVQWKSLVGLLTGGRTE